MHSILIENQSLNPRITRRSWSDLEGFLSGGGAFKLESGLNVTTSKADLLSGIESFEGFGIVDQNRSSSAFLFSSPTFSARRILTKRSFLATFGGVIFFPVLRWCSWLRRKRQLRDDSSYWRRFIIWNQQKVEVVRVGLFGDSDGGSGSRCFRWRFRTLRWWCWCRSYFTAQIEEVPKGSVHRTAGMTAPNRKDYCTKPPRMTTPDRQRWPPIMTAPDRRVESGGLGGSALRTQNCSKRGQ